MKFKFLLICLFLLVGCKTTTEYSIKNKKIFTDKFTNSGFTLIYDDKLYESKIIGKKLNERDLIIFQRNLKKDTSVKITNPYNEKSLLAKVGKKTKYPNFNNSVVSLRIAKELELDPDEPYIVISQINENNSFVAKKAKTFEEEKEVADKAPVDSISINNLNENENQKKIEINDKKKFNYSIKIADFYYSDSANIMVERIKNEILIKNVVVKKLSENNYRVIVGPFTNIKSLQNGYNSIQKLQFENIEIIKND